MSFSDLKDLAALLAAFAALVGLVLTRRGQEIERRAWTREQLAKERERADGRTSAERSAEAALRQDLIDAWEQARGQMVLMGKEVLQERRQRLELERQFAAYRLEKGRELAALHAEIDGLRAQVEELRRHQGQPPLAGYGGA